MMFEESNTMEDYKKALYQIFNYAKALNELKNPVIFNTNNYKWKRSFKDLPEHESIQCLNVLRKNKNIDSSEDKDDLLRVKKPLVKECPSPPEDLITCIRGNWNNLDEKVEIVTDDNSLLDMFSIWEEKRNQWLERERSARQAMKVFKELYKIYSEVDKESELIELVIGDGILKYTTKEGKEINHPVLIQKVDLKLNSKEGEFTLSLSHDDVELYSTLWTGVVDMDSHAMADCIKELEEKHYSIIDEENTDDFLRRLCKALSPKGYFSKENDHETDNFELAIIREHLLFIRKKDTGFNIAIESILNDIDYNDNIPRFLKRIAGAQGDLALDKLSSQDDAELALSIDDEDILYAKPANAEQILVAKLLEHRDAVLVQGPPGTGKTHTIANLTGHLLSQGKRVLITSHTEKALKVLREKIEEKLQPLCLPVLKDVSKSHELEKSIDALNERRNNTNEALLIEAVNSLEEERKNLITTLRSKREQLKNEIEKEYMPIKFEDEEFTPVEAAKFVAENKEGNDWIPSPVRLGNKLSLNTWEVKELYESNGILTKEVEVECDFEYPDPSLIMNPGEFEELIKVQKSLSNKELDFRKDLWENPRKDINELNKLLVDIIKSVEVIDESKPWIMTIIEDGYKSDSIKEEWKKLIYTIRVLYEETVKFKKYESEYKPYIHESLNNERTLKVLKEMVVFVRSNKTISKFKLVTKPVWNKVLSNIKVKGKVPTKPDEFTILMNLIEINLMRKQVLKKWDKLVAFLGGPKTSDLGPFPEYKLVQYASRIDSRLTWYNNSWKLLVTQLEWLGFKWETFFNENKEKHKEFELLKNIKKKVTDELTPIIEAQIVRISYEKNEETLKNMAMLLSKYSIGAANELIITAVNNKDASKYKRAYKLIMSMIKCRNIKVKRKELIKKLSTSAPEWANAISDRLGIHGVTYVPGDIQLAWKWRQLSDELDKRAEVSIESIQEEIRRLEESVRKVTAELLDKKAWLKKIQSITLDQIQAMEGWKLTMKSIRNGSGKRIGALKVKARELMVECQSAVPAWIMSLNTVVENFNPQISKFDVVIIDEASQADILALAVLYMGKQVVIVGDDEQVSPLSEGEDIEDYEDLIDKYLKDIPNQHLYTPELSIYDIAKTSGCKPVCLKEHFRCVAPIIQFSNKLSYKGRIIPLRDHSNVSCKPSLVSYRVKNSMATERTNQEEAEAVVSLIKSCISKPEYKDKSFGVISLAGEEQAKLIEDKLHGAIEPVDYERTKLLCGTPAQFQGDERDIIFISLVNAAKEGEILTSMGYGPHESIKKRFNVAASRARDQMWIVHSLDPEKDLQEGDLRLKLIKHAESPYAFDKEIYNQSGKTNSLFENEVLNMLRNKGFKVIPQWPVGDWRIDMVVKVAGKKLAVLCDGDKYQGLERIEEDLKYQAALERMGWDFVRIRASKFYRNPDETIKEAMGIYNIQD